MTVSFRFYGHLNAFLTPLRRGMRFRCDVHAPASTRDAIDALGVPSSQIDVIVVNEQPVDFNHPLEHGDTVAVYPSFGSIDLGDTVRARS